MTSDSPIVAAKSSETEYSLATSAENRGGLSSDSTVGTRPASVVPLALTAFIWSALFFAVPVASSFLPATSRSISMFVSAAALICLSIAAIASFIRLGFRRQVFLLTGAAGLIAVMLSAKPLILRTNAINVPCNAIRSVYGITLYTAFPAALPDLTVDSGNSAYSDAADFLETAFPEQPWRILLLSMCQITLAAGIGLWIGGGIDEAGHLIPVALVAGAADIWSVSAGATSIIVRSSQIHYFLLRFPLFIAGSTEIPFLIGFTDFLFFAIFFYASERFELGRLKNLILLSISFFIAVAAALFKGVGLPVLPFMSILFISGNLKQLHLKKDDLRKIILFLAAAGAVAAIFSEMTANYR